MARRQGSEVHQDWGERDDRWRGIRSEIIDVSGTHVHLLRADGPKDGPTQLLVHGLGGSATNWLEVIGGLAEIGPVLAPDLPGFGRTEPPSSRGSRLRNNLGFLKAFARTMGIDTATVHGNSMGGLLSIQLAADAPSLVQRLVLVDPALPGPPLKLHELTPQTVKTFAPFALPTMGRRVLRRMYATRTSDELFDDNQAYVHADPSRVREVLKDVGRENTAYGVRTPWRLDGLVGATESLLAALVGRRTILRAVDEVQAPTLLVWGDQDQLVGRAVMDAIAVRRPDWEFHAFEGVGHAPMAEAPDEYLETVIAWYRRQDSVPTGSTADLDA